jgi:hypothetical protein
LWSWWLVGACEGAAALALALAAAGGGPAAAGGGLAAAAAWRWPLVWVIWAAPRTCVVQGRVVQERVGRGDAGNT